MTVDIDAVLDREWQRIVRSNEARRALARWSSKHPALEPICDLEDLLRRRRDSSAAEPILRALVTEAKVDELAARVVLQALLPGLVKIAGDRRAWQAEAMDDIIGIAWQEIRDFRLELPGRVAASVVLNTRRRYFREFSVQGMLEERRFSPAPTQTPDPVEWAIARVDADAVMQSVRSGLVTASALGTILRTRVLGMPLVDEAEAAGVSVHAMTIRRLQAERKLRLVGPFAA